MMQQQDEAGVFGDLPQALVSEMLNKSGELADGMVRDISKIQDEQESLRDKLKSNTEGRLKARIRHHGHTAVSHGRRC